MSQINSLSTSDLAQFTGTEKLYRITRRHVLTDGTKYLAEEGRCFWLMDAIASHLTSASPSNGQQRLETRRFPPQTYQIQL